MSGLPGEIKQARRSYMEREKLAYADEYSVQMTETNTSVAFSVTLPRAAIENFGVGKGDDAVTYIDYENNAVVHFFGEQEE